MPKNNQTFCSAHPLGEVAEQTVVTCPTARAASSESVRQLSAALERGAAAPALNLAVG